MSGMHNNRSSRRLGDSSIKYGVDEETEVSIPLDEEEKQRSLRIPETPGTRRASLLDFPTFDSSFGLSSMMGLSMTLNTHAEGKRDDSDFEANVDFDTSLRDSMMIQSNRSARSLDIGSSYGDGVDPMAKDNSKKKWKPSPEELFMRYLFIFILLIQVVLSALMASDFYTQPCAFANLAVVAVTIILFVVYDLRVQRQQISLLKSVNRSEAIINSLFPETVRDRIMEEGNFISSRFAPGQRSSGRRSAEIPVFSEREMADTTTTLNDTHKNEDAKKYNDSFVSISSMISDDPIDENTAEQGIPLPSALRSSVTSTTPKFARRKSNQSAISEANTFVSEIGDSTHYRSTAMSVSMHNPSSSKPIADYFPSATIMFADIVGFTSWASIREPAQVFELLETIYGRFDRLAKKKNVFKVETIGDCYVAATGLPNATNDHAVAMASFARRCMESIVETVTELEESLGPGTADLGIRIGIHSGSVIAGVLRGTKSRYQLFGDTMNTASRMESTSAKNKIQLSQETAELIIKAGKEPWVEEREDTVFAKGKGELKTYWLSTEGPKNLSAKEKQALPAILKMMAKANIDPGFIKKKKVLDRNQKRERVVDYHTNVLKGLLKKLLAMHSTKQSDSSENDAYAGLIGQSIDQDGDLLTTKTFAEEAVEGVLFPTFTKSIVGDTEPISIDDSVSSQLRELISTVSRWHRDDLPFHSFEHASHTVLSVTKLLAAIDGSRATPDSVLNKTKSMITHPLAEFALVFAALVPNKHGNEDNEDEKNNDGDNDSQNGNGMATAEKATRRAWSLFLEPSFRDLRRNLFRTRHDFEFFRRLLGKSIVVFTMDTPIDIGEREISPPTGSASLEKISAFAVHQEASQNALAIVQKLLRVSGDSYALQHFPVFQKWNRLLFLETYARHMLSDNDGENKKDDPSQNWYETELESFDARIHLVRSLRDSGICNKLADVYLNAALANKREWEHKGKPIVREYVLQQLQTGERQRQPRHGVPQRRQSMY